jgi:hypothetical protein
LQDRIDLAKLNNSIQSSQYSIAATTTYIAPYYGIKKLFVFTHIKDKENSVYSYLRLGHNSLFIVLPIYIDDFV